MEIVITDMKAHKRHWKGVPMKRGDLFPIAIVEGYKAPNDLNTPYHIARVVRIVVTTQYHVTGIIEEPTA